MDIDPKDATGLLHLITTYTVNIISQSQLRNVRDIMAPNQSNLFDPKYLYDFVVSTTQESTNSGLVQHLQNTSRKQPFTYLCFLADENGDPQSKKSLDEII